MKNLFIYFKKHQGLILSLLLLIVCIFTGTAGVMSAVATVAPGNPTPTAGTEGLPTQLPGEATTVSNAREAGGDLIQNDIDEQIAILGTDENVLDTIKRRVRRQVKVTGMEVDHYMIDEERVTCKTNAAYTGVAGTTSAVLKVSQADAKLFPEFYTINVRGVNGYDPTGKIIQTGVDLMLFVTGKDNSSGCPIVMAVNGPKVNATDADCYIQSIPADTVLISLAPAAYETQMNIAPSSAVPEGETIFLQKMLLNSIVSDYFEAQKKRIPFAQATIAEALIRQYRLRCCRTAWVGIKSKFKVNVGKDLGEQFIYTSGGIRWQIKKQYDLTAKMTVEDLINISMVKFTGRNCSNHAIWLCGKELLAEIQKLDITLHRDITVTKQTVFGMKCTRFETIFGDMDFIHDPTLDVLGYKKCGAVLDMEGFVRYYLKDAEEHNQDMKSQGEEAVRQVIITTDALCLKGYSHIWVNGEGISADIPGTVSVTSGVTLPLTPVKGDVFVLTVTDGVKAPGIYEYNGTAWVDYTGDLLSRA